MATFLVIDTCVWINIASRPALASALDHLQATLSTSAKLVVPSVVLDELKRHLPDTAERAVASLKGQLKNATRRQALQQEILDASTVVESYRHLALLFDELKAKGTREDLRGVVQRVIDVVEWRQDPENSKAGSAKIRLFPLAEPAVKQGGGGSTTCPEWLRMGSDLRTLSVNAFGTDSDVRTDPRRRSHCDSENLRRERWDRFAASRCPIMSPSPRDRVPSGHVERRRGVPAPAGL